jgi:phenylalanyl-tRNA synthetase beta chain
MKFSYLWLKELVPALPPPKKLATLLTMHAFEVEDVKKMGLDYMFEIAILPNRIADASGHVGIAREIAAIAKLRVVIPKSSYKKKSALQSTALLSVTIKDKNACSRYMARIIENVNVSESPLWLQQRLEICGVRPINNIVDATNYVMLETGQPLHAFDYAKLAGKQKKEIIIRRAKKNEHLTTLDNKPIALADGMLVIADNKDPIALAGIKGGKKAEIDVSTQSIVLEAARFDGPSVRNTAEKVDIRTDASIRFSVGLSSSLTEVAIERVSALIADIAHGTVASDIVDIYPSKDSIVHIFLPTCYVNDLLGTELIDKEMISILKRLGCVVSIKNSILSIVPPSERRDLHLPEDIVEEIGRVYGYEYITSTAPRIDLIPPKHDGLRFFHEMMKDFFATAGFQETYNYSFMSEKDIVVMQDTPEMYLELKNPARKEFQYMRAYLTPGLLRNASENLKHKNDVRMFELGAVFGISRARDMTHHEARHIGGFIAHKKKTKKAETFFELKGSLDRFFKELGVSAYFDAIDVNGSVFHPHRTARITIDGERIGIIGEVHPLIMETFSISGELALFEIDADMLARFVRKEKEYQPISRYPSIMRDVSLLVPPYTHVVDVVDIMERMGGILLVDTDLIDMYEGDEIPNGKKNLVFRLIFQSSDRTLSDDEIDTILFDIMNEIEKNLEWEVRK